jgi:hypothetical protein
MEAKNGLIAGLSATVVLSMIMLMKNAMDVMPHINAIQSLTKINGVYFGLPMVPWIAWVEHFAIGTLLWGLIFAGTWKIWPGHSFTVKGLSFSVAAWLLMMIIIMPMAGAGLFGMGLGIAAPMATLMLHLIFGAVLGGVFGALHKREHSHDHRHAHA